MTPASFRSAVRAGVLEVIGRGADQLQAQGSRRTAFAMRVYGAQLGRDWRIKSEHLPDDAPPPTAIPGTRAKQSDDAQRVILGLIGTMVRGYPEALAPLVERIGRDVARGWEREDQWEKIRGMLKNG